MKIIIILSSLLIIPLAAQSKIYKTLFTSRSAVTDTSVKGWENIAEDKVPRIIKMDLNSDSVKEIIETKYADCSSNGCTWNLKDGKTKKNIGQIKGATVYVSTKKTNDYNDLETFWKMGFNKAIVYFYNFYDGKYKEMKKKNIAGKDLEKYFSNKPQFTEEIKAQQ